MQIRIITFIPLLKARKSFFTVYHLTVFKQKDDHTCYIIKYFETALVLYYKWNKELEQKTEELYEDGWCTSQTTVFSIDERVFMVLKYTETGNVLGTIRRFQWQFPNRNVHYCRRSCPNLNHIGHTYCNCPLLFVCRVSSDSETAFETLWLIPEKYRFLYTLKP